MWLRAEIDADYSEIGRLLLRSIYPISNAQLTYRFQQLVGKHHLALGCSVRSIFSLLLDELNLKAGSVISCSAVNIPQMEEIIRFHKLVPQPVDIAGATFSPSPRQVEEVFRTFRPRAYLHASYFGALHDASSLQRLADKSSVFTIDDRSQCFSAPLDANPWADVTLFSLGPYKSPTAAGGAIALFRDSSLAGRMNDRIASLQPEPHRKQFVRLSKLLLTKLLCEPAWMGVAAGVLGISQLNYGDFISNQIRRVAAIDTISTASLTLAPSKALSSCVLITAERFTQRRFARRKQIAYLLRENLHPHIVTPGFHSPHHSHWLFPVLSRDPASLIQRLRAANFDAARMAKTLPIGGSSPEHRSWNATAAASLSKLVLLPADTRMPDSEVVRLCQIVNQHEALRNL